MKSAPRNCLLILPILAVSAVSPASAQPPEYDIDHLSTHDPTLYAQRPVPEAADTVFVADPSEFEGECLFSSDGPIVFDLEIDRYVGDTEKLAAADLISGMAVLKIHMFDLDGPSFGELHEIYFEDTLLTATPIAFSCYWQTVRCEVPIYKVNFATLNGSGAPNPGHNEIRIELDTANPTPKWCTSVAWASLSIQAASPVLLVHGIRSDHSAWNGGPWFPGLFDDFGLPVRNDLDMGAMDYIQSNATKIGAKVSAFKEQTGSDRISLVCHSKGGIDSRYYSNHSDDIDRIVQLGTPNGGSPLADAALAIVGPTQLTAPGRAVFGEDMPALVQLTVGHMSAFNIFEGGLKPQVGYTAVAGDYDPGIWLETTIIKRCVSTAPSAVGRGTTRLGPARAASGQVAVYSTS